MFPYLCGLMERPPGSQNRSNGSKINHKMKTLIVACMLLFNYLDTLPKLYTLHLLLTCMMRDKSSVFEVH